MLHAVSTKLKTSLLASATTTTITTTASSTTTMILPFPSPLPRSRRRSMAARSSTDQPSPEDSGRQLKILMLHGFTQSGPLFRAKTRALEKALKKAFPAAPAPGHLPSRPGGLALHYITGPHRLKPADIPGFGAGDGASGFRDGAVAEEEEPDAFGWWVRRGEGEPYTYWGMDKGFERIAQALREEGPFDGVLGFSQGASAAAMVASLLEPGRRGAFERAQGKGGMRYPESFEEDTGMVEGCATGL